MDNNNNPWAHLGNDSKAGAPITSAKAVSFMPIIVDDDEDEELQKALALSMHTSSSREESSAAAPAASGASSFSEYNTAIMEDAPTHLQSNNFASTKHQLLSTTYSSSVRKADADFNSALFHKFMWNDTITTLNDKERWIYECITTSCADNTEKDGDVAMKSEENDNSNTESKKTELLDAFTSQQNWGLTQRRYMPRHSNFTYQSFQ